MIRRTLEFLSAEVRGLHAAAYILAVSSLLSSLLALLRDRLLAHLFGASVSLDLYYAAFRIPDAVFIAVGALVSAYMLIPELSRRDFLGQKKYLDTIVVGYSILVLLVSVFAALMAPLILQRFFPAFVDAGHLSTLTMLTRILLLQAAFLGLSNIAAAVTQFKHRYVLYACSPIVYNLSIIFGALVLYPYLGLVGLAWGVVLGALLHVGIQIPAIVRDGFLQQLPRFIDKRAFFETVWLSLPRALALSMNQIAFFGLTVLAGSLAAGSISVFVFGYNLNNVPLGIIGASFATAAFPTLAYAFSRGEREVFLEQVSIAARQIFFWSMPAIALLVVLRAHIVRAVLGSGAFDWTDTRLTAAMFALFGISLAAQGIVLLLVRAFYASGRTFAPFVVSSASALLTIFLGLFFLHGLQDPRVSETITKLLRVQDVGGTQVLVLAFAYSLSLISASFVLILYFETCFRGFLKRVILAFGESIAAALASGAASYGTLHVIGDITLSSTLLSVLVRASIAGFIGIAAGALVYYLLGNREFSENVQALRRKLWREGEPIASAESGLQS